MTEETQTATQPSMNILAQFIRDMSFENIFVHKKERLAMCSLMFKSK